MILMLFVLLGCFVFSQMNYEEDISKFLPQDSMQGKYQKIYQDITAQKRVAIMFTSKDTSTVLPSDSLIPVMDDFQDILADKDTSHVIPEITAMMDDDNAMELLNFIYQNIPYFLCSDDYRHIDSLLSEPGYIHSSLVKDKEMLMMPTSLTAQMIERDPLNLFSVTLQRLSKLNRGTFKIIDDHIFTEDGKVSLMYFQSPYGAQESNKNADLSAVLNGVADATMAQHPNVQIVPIGSSIISVTNANRIKSDSVIAVSIAVVVILLLLFLHYRRLSDILWIAVSIIIGWLFALVGLYLFRDSVSMIVLGIGSVIIGICVNYPLHYLDHLMETGDNRQTLRDMVTPLLIGNITTVAAFLCLVWLDAQAMRDLGAFGSLMLIGTILFVLVFLPLYVNTHKSKVTHTNVHVDFLNIENKHQRRWFMTIVIVLTLFFGYYSLGTSFDSNLQHINYMSTEQQRMMDVMSSKTSSCMYAVSEGKDMDEAISRHNEIIDNLPTEITKTGIIDFIPSKEKQQQRLEMWNSLKSKHKDLLSQLYAEAGKEDFATDAFSGFEALFSKDFTPQSTDYFKPVTDVLSNGYVVKDTGSVSIVSYLEGDEEQIRASVNSDDSNFVFNTRDISNSLVRILNDSFNYIGFVCGFVVFFFLCISFGRLELSLLSFLPLAVAWLWILGLMNLTNIQFNIVNVILATFIFGQGDDYTIFITEGLIEEYAKGRKQLASYKRSVALSALIMFVGIGTLIFAKHPALKSLAQVTIIGMFAVVLMANYLPPIVFRWMTRKKDKPRLVPITLKRLFVTIYSFTAFLLLMLVFNVFTFFYFKFKSNTLENKLKFHGYLSKWTRYSLNLMPGVKYRIRNSTNENFDKPSIIICNHQSHLDLLCLLILSPKVIFLTNNWVWNSPFYGYIVRKSEFIPVTDGVETNMSKIRDLYNQGFSIAVFPEGTRCTDFKVHRFHKGAFYMAEQLNADIVPIFLHGTGHVLPKVDFMLNEGTIDIEVQKRIGLDDEAFAGSDHQRRKAFHKFYVKHYAELCDELETSDYMQWYLRHQYIYKGVGTERRYVKNMKNNHNYSDIVDAEADSSKRIFEDCGQGELPMLYALCHRQTEVLAIPYDEDDYLLLKNMSNLPSNMTVLRKGENV